VRRLPLLLQLPISGWNPGFLAVLILLIATIADAQETDSRKLEVKSLPLPGANGLVMLDYLAYAHTSRRLWVPAGNTGSVDVINTTTDQIERVEGFAVAQVELAVLSAIEHGQSTDIPLAARIASAAILASADIDVERSRLYLDLILISLAQNASEAFEATMNSLGFEYQSDFARRYYGQGKAEGRIEIILKLLALRFGPLTEAVQARVRGAQDAQLDAVAERMLTAKTLEEAVSQLI
jgi:hypothetical protein